MPRYRPQVAKIWQAVLLGLAGMMLSASALADTAPAAGAANHITTQLLVEGPAAPGGTVTLAIAMNPAPGWHGYWLNPGDAGYAMRLGWHLPAGAGAGDPQYPVPQTLVLAGLMNHVYTRDYAVLVPLTVPAGAAAGANLPISVDAEWLACSDQTCVPEKARLSAVVHIGTPLIDPRFDAWRAALPAPLGGTAYFAGDAKTLRLAIPLPASVAVHTPHLFVAQDGKIEYAAPQGFSRSGDTLVVTLMRRAGAPAPASLSAVLALDDGGISFTARPGPVPSGGTPLTDGALPLIALLGLALAGGLLLNIMPCVFPILSLKALSLARAGGHEAEARAEGLAYSAGVITACLALGGGLLALRAGGAQVGWAFQLQEPWVVAALLALAAAITANLLGLYELAVPGFAQQSSKGAFATGLLAAFVATPCTGPFMATAMGAALLLPVAQALSLFFALGLGIALPFLAIAFVPALRRRMPRPGAWMNWFRRAMAVPMALTALALVWLASRLGGWSFAGATVLLTLVLLILLAMVGYAQRRGRPVALHFTVLLAGLLLNAVVNLPHFIHAPSASESELIPAAPYSDAALARALASGHPVFAYFTADWCLTCKVNERLAIERPEVRDAFAAAHVTVLVGDWTRRDPAITRYLTEHGAAGVPLYVWYPGGNKPPRILPQVLTPDLLTGLPKT